MPGAKTIVSIYGIKSAKNDILTFNKHFNDSLESLYRAVTIITIDVHTLFPPTFLLNEIVGQMTARARLPPVLFVRITWRQMYPNKFFDTNNVYHRLQIKDIYLKYHLDHTNDPLFNDIIGKFLR